MTTEFIFIGWYKDEIANHDKVWGYFLRPTPDAVGKSWITKGSGWNCVVFWARRGRAMQFKPDITGSALVKLANTKLDKGYERITPYKLQEIWPTFNAECESKLMWDVLAGKIK